MDLNQLRAFVEVAREGNLTKASNLLFLSQPAISAKIKALEEEIGLKLFERTPQGMKLTHHGEILREEASRTLDAANSFIFRARSVGAELSGQIRIGTIGEPIALQFGEFLSGMLAAYPNVTVSISQGISGVIIDRVLSRELDAGFVIGAPTELGLHVVKLTLVKFLITGPIAWKEELNSSDWNRLAQFPWVGTPPKCSFNGIARALFDRNNINPKRVAEADQDNMLKSLVIRGFGLSILREDQALAAAAAGELFIWEHDFAESVLCFIQRDNNAHLPINKVMTDMLDNIWRTQPVH
jgi:DNA-binding transcriptional LysR family regulator